MASPSETTLIVLTAAVGARLIGADAAQFWQVVTAIGMTVTPLLALLGQAAWAAGRPRRAHAGPAARATKARARSWSASAGSAGWWPTCWPRTASPSWRSIRIADLIAAGRREGYPVACSAMPRAAAARSARRRPGHRGDPDDGRAGRGAAAGQACAANIPACRSSPAPATPATPPSFTAPGLATPCPRRWRPRCNCRKRCWSISACRWGR